MEHLNNALILNIDDYHNIHVQQQPRTTATSLPTHMATIVANPCLTLAIPRNQVLNPKIVDGELIIRNIDKRFIVNLGVPYYKYIKNCIKREYTDIELLEKLTLHSYNDRLAEKKNSLQTVYKQKPMQEYLSKFAIPVVADWPGQFYIRKAIAQKALLDNPNIPEFVMAFLPMMGPLHVSLNAHELVFKKNAFLFNNIYKSVFRICKDLVPLVLDVYAIHHQEGNWLAYEEATIHCWSDLFLQLDRKNYKRAPLMFFSDIFYWIETNHPIINFIINHLATLSDSPVEIFHSIIRRCTSKSSTGEQLRIAAHTAYQQCHNNDFQQQFVRSEKYPYSPKQLRMLSQKCAIYLLELFTKIYHYLQNEIRKNTDALIKSLTKSLGENLSKEDIEEDKGDDEDPNEIHEISDDVMVERQLEDAKKLFFEMYSQTSLNAYRWDQL
ncbi:hypothetical protein C2G38_2226275 [Gigaspora rosea]|uniref:Uncharacterized protein n=1 Tax=Gigaspora rosea TaxID=44941 RepID=A0A397TYD7_9GLOM|nr:hypothetical protein C2G38_2226275 [Gigaspora rosea]